MGTFLFDSRFRCSIIFRPDSVEFLLWFCHLLIYPAFRRLFNCIFFCQGYFLQLLSIQLAAFSAVNLLRSNRSAWGFVPTLHLPFLIFPFGQATMIETPVVIFLRPTTSILEGGINRYLISLGLISNFFPLIVLITIIIVQ